MIRKAMTAVTMAMMAASAIAVAAGADSGIIVRAGTRTVAVLASCPKSSTTACHLLIKLRADGVVVGHATTTVAPGRRHRVHVHLSALGRKMLHKHHALRVQATVNTTSNFPPGVPPGPIGTCTPATCPGGAPGPCRPIGPPALPTPQPGATGVIGGIYTFGGPPNPPNCVGPVPPTPAQPGTVRLLDAAGNVVAVQTVAPGQTFNIAAPPGTYTVDGSPLPPPQSSQSSYICHAASPVTVTAGEQVSVAVGCSIS